MAPQLVPYRFTRVGTVVRDTRTITGYRSDGVPIHHSLSSPARTRVRNERFVARANHSLRVCVTSMRRGCVRHLSDGVR